MHFLFALFFGAARSVSAQDAPPSDSSGPPPTTVEVRTDAPELEAAAAGDPSETVDAAAAGDPSETADAAHAHGEPHVHAHLHRDHVHEADDEDVLLVEEEGWDDGFELGSEAVVDATTPDVAPASASELRIDVGLLRAVPRTSAESLYTLVPSLFLVNHAGSYHASTVYFRGFDAGEGQDLEVLVDGVPINEPSNAHGHGYADAHFVIPEVVVRLHALPGPFSPEQSDFAVAGTVEHELGVPDRGVHVALSGGSFDTVRLVGVVAPAGLREGTFLALDLRRSAGFATNRSSLSGAAMGRLELELSRELTFHVLAAGHFGEFASAGVVPSRDVRAMRLPCDASPDAQFFCTPDPNQGGASARGLVSTGLTLRAARERLDLVVFGGYRSLRIRENFTGFLVSDEGDGLDEQYAVGTLGLRGRYRAGFDLFGRAHVLDVGVLVRRTDGDSRLLRVRRTDAAPHTAVFDDGLHLTQIGGHVGLDLSPFDALDARLAVRADAYLLSATERALSDVDRMGERVPEMTTDAFGLAIQPRVSLRAHLFRSGAAPDDGDDATPEQPAWQLDWTTSFGLGTRSADAIGLSTGERAPFAEVVASETGLALTGREGTLALDAQIAAFHTYVGQDLVFSPTSGRNEPVGASSRLGAQASVRVRHEAWLDVSASFAWNQGYLLAAGADRWWNFVSEVAVPYVPRWVGRLDAAIDHPIELMGEPFSFGGAVGVGWMGERPLPLGGAADQVVLVDASAHVGWRMIEVGVALQNLFDVRWASSVFDYAARWDPSVPATGLPDRHVAAGAPLTVMATLALHIDPADPLGEGAPEPEPPPPAHVHLHEHEEAADAPEHEHHELSGEPEHGDHEHHELSGEPEHDDDHIAPVPVPVPDPIAPAPVPDSAPVDGAPIEAPLPPSPELSPDPTEDLP